MDSLPSSGCWQLPIAGVGWWRSWNWACQCISAQCCHQPGAGPAPSCYRSPWGSGSWADSSALWRCFPSPHSGIFVSLSDYFGREGFVFRLACCQGWLACCHILSFSVASHLRFSALAVAWSEVGWCPSSWAGACSKVVLGIPAAVLVRISCQSCLILHTNNGCLWYHNFLLKRSALQNNKKLHLLTVSWIKFETLSPKNRK